MRHRFFSAKTSNGAGAQLSVSDGGTFLISVGGTWDSATLTITVTTPAASGVVPTDMAFTADATVTLLLPGNSVVQATISSAGGSTSLSAEASK